MRTTCESAPHNCREASHSRSGSAGWCHAPPRWASSRSERRTSGASTRDSRVFTTSRQHWQQRLAWRSPRRPATPEDTRRRRPRRAAEPSARMPPSPTRRCHLRSPSLRHIPDHAAHARLSRSTSRNQAMIWFKLGPARDCPCAAIVRCTASSPSAKDSIGTTTVGRGSVQRGFPAIRPRTRHLATRPCGRMAKTSYVSEQR